MEFPASSFVIFRRLPYPSRPILERMIVWKAFHRRRTPMLWRRNWVTTKTLSSICIQIVSMHLRTTRGQIIIKKCVTLPLVEWYSLWINTWKSLCSDQHKQKVIYWIQWICICWILNRDNGISVTSPGTSTIVQFIFYFFLVLWDQR